MRNEQLIEIGTCCKCKTSMALPEDLYHAAKKSEKITFHCAYGHPQHFVQGETDLERMRRRAERAEQRVAHRDDTIDSLERSVAAQKGNVTRLKNRAAAGVCPCCNRSFQNLHRHMQNKHPGFTKEKEVKSA